MHIAPAAGADSSALDNLHLAVTHQVGQRRARRRNPVKPLNPRGSAISVEGENLVRRRGAGPIVKSPESAGRLGGPYCVALTSLSLPADRKRDVVPTTALGRRPSSVGRARDDEGTGNGAHLSEGFVANGADHRRSCRRQTERSVLSIHVLASNPMTSCNRRLSRRSLCISRVPRSADPRQIQMHWAAGRTGPTGMRWQSCRAGRYRRPRRS